MAEPPLRFTPPPPSISEDAVDKLLIAIDRVTTSVGDLGEKVEGQSKEIASLRTDLEIAKRNGQRTERERRENLRAATEGDAKNENAQAGYVIALEETRKNAKKAVELATKAIELQTQQATASKAIVVETKASAAAIQTVAEEELKKPKIPMKLAALLNLFVVVGYVILELLKSLGKH